MISRMRALAPLERSAKKKLEEIAVTNAVEIRPRAKWKASN